MTGTIYKLEVNPQIPERLARLEELANNLWYSWDRPTRGLFASLSHPLWQASNHNPKAFLKRADQKKLEASRRKSGLPRRAEPRPFGLRQLSREAWHGARSWPPRSRKTT